MRYYHDSFNGLTPLPEPTEEPAAPPRTVQRTHESKFHKKRDEEARKFLDSDGFWHTIEVTEETHA